DGSNSAEVRCGVDPRASRPLNLRNIMFAKLTILPSIAFVLVVPLFTAGCHEFASPSGGGQVSFKGQRKANPADVSVPAGYRVEVVAQNLCFPTGVTFDEQGRPYVVEAGYS